MQLTFGNMTLETNIFHVAQHTGGEDDLHAVSFIEEIVEEYFEENDCGDALGSCLVSSHENEGSHKRESLGVCPISSSNSGSCDNERKVGERCVVTAIKRERGGLE